MRDEGQQDARMHLLMRKLAEGETANRIPSQPPSRTEPSGYSGVADAATPVRMIFRSPVVTRSAYI